MSPYDDCPGDFFNEYNDYDATSCSTGDYNTFEEYEIFADLAMEREYDYDDVEEAYNGYDHYDDDLD